MENTEQPYSSTLPSISIEFQDGSFLDVEAIEGFTLAKTDESIPHGMLMLDICIGERHWYQIKNISINGRPASIISFERMAYKFDLPAENVGEGDIPYHYVKVISKYDLTEEEIVEILSDRMIEFEQELEAPSEEEWVKRTRSTH